MLEDAKEEKFDKRKYFKDLIAENIKTVQIYPDIKKQITMDNQEILEMRTLKCKFKKDKGILIRRNEALLKSLKKEHKRDEVPTFYENLNILYHLI